MAEKRDYIAVVRGPYGGGSWARGADKETTAKRALSIFRSDWKSLIGTIKKGTKVPVNIYDVTGHDTVMIGEDYCWIEDGPNRNRLNRLEVVTITA